MSIVVATPPSEARAQVKAGEQRLLLWDISWDAYVQIGEALRDRPAIRQTYDRGQLEIMTTSTEHEILKQRLSYLIRMLTEEHALPLVSAGNMTFQREGLKRGIEPDDCFWIAHEAQVRGRLEWDPARDPPPDLALEIEISRSALNRMSIHAAFGIPEVWRYDGETFRVHLLQPSGAYQEVERSPTFPKIPPAEFAQFIRPNPDRDSLTENRTFREWVRERLTAP